MLPPCFLLLILTKNILNSILIHFAMIFHQGVSPRGFLEGKNENMSLTLKIVSML